MRVRAVWGAAFREECPDEDYDIAGTIVALQTDSPSPEEWVVVARLTGGGECEFFLDPRRAELPTVTSGAVRAGAFVDVDEWPLSITCRRKKKKKKKKKRKDPMPEEEGAQQKGEQEQEHGAAGGSQQPPQPQPLSPPGADAAAEAGDPPQTAELGAGGPALTGMTLNDMLLERVGGKVWTCAALALAAAAGCAGRLWLPASSGR